MATYVAEALNNPEKFFQVKAYTGNGSAGHAITLDGSEDMQPDFVWIKQRDSRDHFLFNSVVGATKYLASNLTQAEQTDANTMTGFDSDGFTLGNGVGCNENTDTHIAWCWKSGASFSNDASATSIGSIDSSGVASSDSGLSIFTFTSTGSQSTIAHNLGSAPDLYIIKKRNSTGSWFLYTTVIDASLDRFIMNSTNAKGDDSNTVPSSTVITSDNGSTSDTMVCYAFKMHQGFSKVGSYTGNGNADGTFVYTGFKPAFVMFKKSSASGTSWGIFDNKRDVDNVAQKFLQPNDSGGEESGDRVDFLSNGFKLRTTWTVLNNSGDTFIYMAFAEAPFVNSNGVPCNAR